MSGALVNRGGIFEGGGGDMPMNFWSQPIKIIPALPGRSSMGFRAIGPWGFGADAPVPAPAPARRGERPYYLSPPEYYDTDGNLNVPAQDYGREGGVFYNSARRCAVNLSPERMANMRERGNTPRGGVFDGGTVAGAICSYGVPVPGLVPQRVGRLREVPEAAQAVEEVPYSTPSRLNSFEGCCGSPDGLGRRW